MFQADTTDVQEFTSQLSETIKLNHNLSLTPDPLYPPEPFELVVLEEMLSSIVNQYAYRINLILPVVKCILNSFHVLRGVDTDNAVVRMIPMSNALTNFQTAISELRSAVEDVLESDEDLNKLCLTRQDRAIRIEVEVLLENISKKTEELYNEVKEILLNIQTSKKAIEMIMSNTRNYLMAMNLQISLLSLTLSSAAVIGSIFGMNLLSGYEQHPSMFYIILSCMPIIGLSIYILFRIYYRRRTQQFADMTRSALLTTNFFDKFNSVNFVKKLVNETGQEEFRKILLEVIGKDISKEEIDTILHQLKSFQDEQINPEDLFEDEDSLIK